MADNTPTTANYLSDAESLERTKLGKYVLYFSLIIIFLLASIAIFAAYKGSATGSEKFNNIKDILTMILPLIGTWIGTVLAFYFSRENYVAAAQQSANLIRQLTPEQRLQSIPVTEVMLDMSADTTLKLTLPPGNNFSAVNLQTAIITPLEQNNRNRLPIVDSTGKILYILHQSFIDKFLLKQPSGTSAATLTLQNLLADPALNKTFAAFAIVGKNARLIAVKQLIDGNPDCSDAFVTEDGTSGSRAIGWITNVIVQEKSMA
ncbi:hypothetical protein ACMYSK_00795 [Klebsiella sp. I138]|uniref:hypothetical protein n=1 Tax=Klebsiella sp. I138 TaxID=2755385 RepID=UPI003DA7FC9A